MRIGRRIIDVSQNLVEHWGTVRHQVTAFFQNCSGRGCEHRRLAGEARKRVGVVVAASDD